MPHPIPDERVIEVALNYLSRRQIQKRATTLRQFHKRMGLGADRLAGILEKEKVEYILLPHPGKWRHGNVEIVLVRVPDEIADWLKIDNEELAKTSQAIFKGREIKVLPPVEAFPVSDDSPGDEWTPEETMDPYAPYRISKQQFKEMESDLLYFEELIRLAKQRGYSYRSIYRAVGGPKMRYVFPSPVWRPYVVGKKRYYAKEVLQKLHESDKTYLHQTTAIHKRRLRQIDRGEIKNPLQFTSKYELWMAMKDETLKDYLIR